MLKHRGSLMITLGALLLSGAICITIYNIWDDKRAEASIRDIISQIVNTGEASEAIPDYILNPEMDMPTIEIDGHRYIGTVTVPALDLELPVMETWSYPKMKIAPCRYSGSAYLNDMVIAAHNYPSHFGRLRNLQEDDEVIFTDVVGNVFRYYVDETEVLPPTAVGEMTAGDWDLTLFTCTIGARARFAVRCIIAED